MSYALRRWAAAGLVAAVGLGCDASGDRPPAPPPDPSASAGPVDPPGDAPERPTPAPSGTGLAGFVAIEIDSNAGVRQLARRLGPDRLTLLLKINRVDRDHVRAGDTLFLPADTTRGWLDLAPFPVRLGGRFGLDSMPKLLLVSQRVQAVGGYQFGQLVFWGPTSTGKRATPTPNGWFHTTWKAKETRSTDNEAWLPRWYFNFENRRGISFHQYELPGLPASHACVRLLEADAEWIYRWADQWEVSADGRRVLRPGTPVLVFGEFGFGQVPPWRRLGDDPAAATVSEDEISRAAAMLPDSAGAEPPG